MSTSSTSRKLSMCGVLLQYLLPWRLRRLIFLSSLYGLMVGKDSRDLDHLRRVNDMLKLSDRTLLPTIPMVMHSVIWYRRSITGVLVEDRQLTLKDLTRPDVTEKEKGLIIQEVLKRMPRWLWYTVDNNTNYDVKRLVRCVRTMNMA